MTRGRQLALGFTAVAVLVVAVLVGRSFLSDSDPGTQSRASTTTSPTTTPSTPTTTPTTTGGESYPPAGYTAFRDDPAGFEIAYPSGWVRLRPPDRQDDLLVSHGTSATNGVTMLVRVTPLGLTAPTTLKGLKKLRPQADKIIHAGGFEHVIGRPRAIVLGGVPGYLYVYQFALGAGQPPVAHVHYIFFKGDALIAVVFQIAPAEALAQLAHQLDVVARTFRATSP